jgi:uncharacterized protein YcgI (DUF1989 family)
MSQETVANDRTRITIPARHGKAIRAKAGTVIKVINTHGSQVLDTWAFNADDISEYMSMEHTRAYLLKISPGSGDRLVTNRRRPILSIVEDTTPGGHDALIAACDEYRYEQLGAAGYHDNCSDNLRGALRELGQETASVPSPLNLFMYVPVGKNGTISFEAPLSQPGQYVTLRSEMDAIVVFSACPQDMVPVNGASMQPQDVEVEIY